MSFKNQNYIPEVCNSLAVTLAPNWKMLALKDFQVVLLLLQQCGSFCKLVQLARSAPPLLITEALEYFDNDVHHCFSLSTVVDTTSMQCLAIGTAQT